MMAPATEAVDREAKGTDGQVRAKRKERFNKTKQAREEEMKVGEQVLIKHARSSTSPPYDPKPYTIIELKGTRVTARRGEK